MEEIYKVEVFFDGGDSAYLGDVLLKQCDDKTLMNEVIPSIIKEETERENDIHHILATLLPMGKLFPSDYEFLRQYMFLGDGTVFVERKYRDSFDESDFKGRNENELHFKVGDLVTYLVGNELKYGVICMIPPKIGQFQYLDSSDDSYTILEGLKELPNEIDNDTYMEYHTHVELINVFPYREIEEDE